MQCKNQNGFTLLETLIVVTIVAIVTTLALVSFQSWSDETGSRAALSKLRSSLTLARIEAIKRGGWVRLCGSPDGTSCSGGIGEGWLIYHDSDTSGTFDNTDTTLISETINSNRITVALTDENEATRENVSFDYRGYTNQSSKFSATRGEFDFQFWLNRIGRTL